MSDKPEKVDLSSPDLAAEKRAAFEDLFPGVITDGVFDVGRMSELLDIKPSVVPDGGERFGLMWAGKNEAVRSLLAPSRGALVPDLDESIDFDSAENVFIEGDNLEVLKLLQKSYNDKVKLIVIDPLYNTGNDFVYNDDFGDGLRGYLEFTGELDDEGRRRSAGAEVLGRRHSRWLTMMYPRLVLARNLLRQDGAIFVFIDDNEGAHLRALMDEVFGPENFLANVVWKHTQQSKNDERYFSRHWNGILVYRRSPALTGFVLPRTDEHNKAYRNPDSDPKGMWRSGDVRSPSARPNLKFPIKTPSGGVINPPATGWRWSAQSVAEKIASGEIIFSPDETRIVRKIYLADQEGRTPENVWDGADVGVTRDANREIRDIFGTAVFDTPKPTEVLRRILLLATTTSDDIVLDFFAGSGSTAHAVALQNAADGGRRRNLCVNIPEPVAPDSAAADAGYTTVSEMTLARLVWVTKNVDGNSGRGLRVFRLTNSSFIGRTAETENLLEFDLSESTLVSGEPYIDDLAAEILVKEGVALDVQWERHTAGGDDVIVADGVAVVASLDITDEVVNEALELRPRVIVFLEDGFAGSDAVKANASTNAKNLGITMKTV